ncbi:ATP-binding protein [Rhodococcus sp. NPDC047139]|uniref:ATP-binding protein n=1 Tax=Rhodococcus sp. NPDC047139 TaxID=3155141 RepID=UPI0033CF53C7
MSAVVDEPVETTGERPPDRNTAAADRLTRMFVRFVAIGYLCYFTLLIPRIIEAPVLTASWWTPAAIVAIFGSGMALALVSFRGTLWMKRAAAVNALAYIVLVALWFVAWNGTKIPQDESLWFTAFPGVASLAAAVAWRPRRAFVHMIVAVLLAQCANHLVRDAPFGSFLVSDLAFALVFCAVFLAAAVVGLGTSRTLDETIAATQAAAAAAAAAEARNAERERFDALVHDRVMSTLLAASRNSAGASLAEQARRAVAELDELRGGPGRESALDADAVMARVRSAATEADEDIVFVGRVASECDGASFPTEPARAIAAALAEAVRNSLRHAGDDATRKVEVDVAPRWISVQLVDDGRGFEPDAVDPHRLGLEVSIRGRMRRLAGGHAMVESAPGAGTRVLLSWRDSLA